MLAGVDLGGTTIGIAIGDREGVIHQAASIPTDSHLGPESVLARIAEAIAATRVEAVGVGLPGTLDRETGLVRFLPNMPGNWRNVPAGPMLSKRLGVPVFLLNDARMATLGELRFGLGRSRPGMSMVFFTLGTGVGGGVVIDGKLRLGPIGAAGEVGHQTIVGDGPRCGCGNHGCLEALAAAPAIVGEAARMIRSGLSPKLYELVGGDISKLTPKEVAEAAPFDAAAADLIDRVAGYLAIAAANLINIIHPDAILFGGGVAAMGETLLKPLRTKVRQRVGMFPAEGVIIERSPLGDQAGVLGGIALAASGGDV